MVYKATFNLPEKYAYSGGVKGNGKTLTMMDGLSDTYVGTFYNRSARAVNVAIQAANKTLPGSLTQANEPAQNVFLGVTTDVSQSGIIVEPDTQISMIIKY